MTGLEFLVPYALMGAGKGIVDAPAGREEEMALRGAAGGVMGAGAARGLGMITGPVGGSMLGAIAAHGMPGVDAQSAMGAGREVFGPPLAQLTRSIGSMRGANYMTHEPKPDLRQMVNDMLLRKEAHPLAALGALPFLSTMASGALGAARGFAASPGHRMSGAYHGGFGAMGGSLDKGRTMGAMGLLGGAGAGALAHALGAAGGLPINMLLGAGAVGLPSHLAGKAMGHNEGYHHGMNVMKYKQMRDEMQGIGKHSTVFPHELQSLIEKSKKGWGLDSPGRAISNKWTDSIQRKAENPGILDRLKGLLKKSHVLSEGEREHIPKSEFAVPSKGKAESGSYPMPDKAHARAAIGFAEMHHPGSSTAARVKAKAHSLYPDMGKSSAEEILYSMALAYLSK